METVRDMLFVKNLEKILGRRLTEDEMDGQPFYVRMPDGRWAAFKVALLVFPYDLITKPEDISTDIEFINAA